MDRSSAGLIGPESACRDVARRFVNLSPFASAANMMFYVHIPVVLMAVVQKRTIIHTYVHPAYICITPMAFCERMIR